jgi:sugar O-acyltransferase (sialic acid O-acetyltransferase NeuD family)
VISIDAPARLRHAPGRTPTTRRRPGIVGIGAGGHAKCVIEAVRSVFRFRVVALLDADPRLTGSTVLGCPVLGGDGIAAIRAEGVEAAFTGIGGVGSTRARREAAALLRDTGFTLPTIVHAAATVAGSAELDVGVQVMAGALVGAEARLHRDVLVNAGAIVGHDVEVGECAHVAQGARVGGAVTIGAGAHVGSGAVVLQGRTIGEGAIVGAGAVVIDDVPPRARVGGLPAHPLSPAAAVGR